MSDFISKMSFGEMNDACEEILGSGPWAIHSLNGLMVEKLSEWHCGISYINRNWKIAHDLHMRFEDQCLQVAFLRTAQALGKWNPPIAKELTLEERVLALEEKLQSFPRSKT